MWPQAGSHSDPRIPARYPLWGSIAPCGSALVNKTVVTAPVAWVLFVIYVFFCFHIYMFSPPDLPYLNNNIHSRIYIYKE